MTTEHQYQIGDKIQILDEGIEDFYQAYPYRGEQGTIINEENPGLFQIKFNNDAVINVVSIHFSKPLNVQPISNRG